MERRTISILITVCMFFSLLFIAFPVEGTGITASMDGDGSIDNPHKISSAEDLLEFARLLNNDSYPSTSCAVLTQDITFNSGSFSLDINGVPLYNGAAITSTNTPSRVWTPITKFYEGVFDGGNHTINGLYANSTSSSSYPSIFNYMGSNAVVKNLNVNGLFFASDTATAAVSIAYYNQGTIENCHSSIHVSCRPRSGGSNVAGICTINSINGKIKNCRNSGMIYAPKAGGQAAGITNQNQGSILDCSNSGEIRAGQYATGITYSSDGPISRCINEAKVSQIIPGESFACAAGIVGDVKGYTVSDSYNTGEIYSYVSAAGIAIKCSEADASLASCYNIGKISSGSNVAECYPILMETVGTAPTNCFYLPSTGFRPTPVVFGIEKTLEEFASGEIAWKLNNSSAHEPIWFQNLSENEPYPTFVNTNGGGLVDYHEESDYYYNFPSPKADRDIMYNYVGEIVYPTVYSLDIQWGQLQFTYVGYPNQWDPDVHDYVPGAHKQGWNTNIEGGDLIKLTNHSNTAIDVFFLYTSALEYEGHLGGEFFNGETAVSSVRIDNAESTPLDNPPTVSVRFAPKELSSPLSVPEGNVDIGVITLFISKAI